MQKKEVMLKLWKKKIRQPQLVLHQQSVSLKLLETYKADSESKDYWMHTPISHAAENGKSDVNIVDITYRNALHYASWKGCIDVMKYLVKYCRCDIETLDNEILSPIVFFFVVQQP